MSTTVTETATRSAPVVAVDDSKPAYGPAEEDAQFQATARGDRKGTLKLRGIPTFTNPYEQRRWMKEHMAAAFRYFGKLGYGEGISGHISMRGNVELSTCSMTSNIDMSCLRRSCSEGPLLDEPLCKALLPDEGF